MNIRKEDVLPVIMLALREDAGISDITTALLFEKGGSARAEIFVNEDCIVAGMDVVKWVFTALDEKASFTPMYKDGDRVKKGKKLCSIKATIAAILSGERTVLNFLGKLSGVATITSEFVEAVKGTNARIFDTRKTSPCLRQLEKYAVWLGGGYRHRMGLWDAILIKDNHLTALEGILNMPRVSVIKEAVTKAKARGHKNVEVEVANLEEFSSALEAGADIIMLDNMKIDDIKKAVKMKKSQNTLLDVSGGVTLENVREIAKAGVDRISVGFLTHSEPSIDFSLEICK